MKKRILAALCAAMVLVFGTVTASAAVSPSAGSAVVAPVWGLGLDPAIVAAIAGAPASQTTTATATTKAQTEVVTSAAGKVAVEALPAATTTEGVNVASSVLNLPAGQAVTALASYEVKLDGKLPADISFNVTGVTASSNIAVLHKKADGTWESVPCTVANGKVTATFTSLSPVVIVELPVAKTGVSPKTGEF